MSYRSIHTLDELQTYLSGATIVAFDFETAPTTKYRKEEKSALDAHKSRIVGISFSVTEGDAVYLPLAHTVGKNATDPKVIWNWLDLFFADPTVVKIAHNLAFESQFLYARGIVVQVPCYDTIAAAQMIYKGEQQFRSLSDCGLKTLVHEYFSAELPTYADVVGDRHFDELDPAAEATINYACADADYSLRLYHLLNGWFDRLLPKHRYIIEEIESPTAVYTGIMRYNGLPIDKPLMERKGTEAALKLTELREKIHFIIGDVKIGENASTAAFKKYLYDTLKLPKVKLTDKEKDALDDEALILLKGGINLSATQGYFDSIYETLLKHNIEERGIFYVVNFGGNSDDDITRINAQFVENDDLPLEEQLAMIKAFPLEPSLIVKTQKSLHTYWLIKDGDVKKFRRIQRGLIAHFNADPKCENESRVFRLPGFHHYKHDPVMVEVIKFNPESYLLGNKNKAVKLACLLIQRNHEKS